MSTLILLDCLNWPSSFVEQKELKCKVKCISYDKLTCYLTSKRIQMAATFEYCSMIFLIDRILMVTTPNFSFVVLFWRTSKIGAYINTPYIQVFYFYKIKIYLVYSLNVSILKNRGWVFTERYISHSIVFYTFAMRTWINLSIFSNNSFLLLQYISVWCIKIGLTPVETADDHE